MKQSIITILSILLFCTCNDIDKQQKKTALLSNDDFQKDLTDRTKTTQQILDKYLSDVMMLSTSDTSNFYFGNDIIEADSTLRQLMIGKFVDQTKVIAIEINIKDTTINFYYLSNSRWKLIGSEKSNIPIYKVNIEDLNGDNKNEIITSSSNNMNGNSWKEVYYYADKADTIKYAGSFSTDYELKKDKKQIEETYEGSNYMDHSKTLYEWREEKLVPIKQIVLAHNNVQSNNRKLTLEYYENQTNDIDGLKLKFKEPYNSDNKKQQELWEQFFKAK